MDNLDNKEIPVSKVERVKTGDDASSDLVKELRDSQETLEKIALEIKLDNTETFEGAYSVISEVGANRYSLDYNQLHDLFTKNPNTARAFLHSADKLGEIHCFYSLDDNQKIDLVKDIVNTYPEGYDEMMELIEDQELTEDKEYQWVKKIEKPTHFEPSEIHEEVTINSQIKNLIEKIKSTKGLDRAMIKAIVEKLYVDGRKQSEYIKDIMDSVWFNKLDDDEQVYVAQALSFNDHGRLYTSLGNYDNPIWKKIADRGGWKQAA